MTRRSFDPRLLGGLAPAAFLSRHWQRRPLLIRGAVDTVQALDRLPTREDLFELASRDDVESRLIRTAAGRWTLAHGPFPTLPRAKRDWTLLVQGVNLFDRDADALMRRFDFLSAMRLDDVMMSYAVDGGGVGPHLDSYDVFLLQVHGRRRWRWRDRVSTGDERALVDGVPVKLLKHFVPTHEAILDPGDMLYLPPSCAHEGEAVGPCVTASIGFRAPSWDALVPEFLYAMAEQPVAAGRYADPGRTATTTPAVLDRSMCEAIAQRMNRMRFTADDIETFVGRHFSEPKPHVVFDRPRPLSRAAFLRRARRQGIVLDLRTTMLYRGRRLFLAGEVMLLPDHGRSTFHRLADHRRLDPAAAATLVADDEAATRLHEWWQHGWIVFDDGEADGTS